MKNNFNKAFTLVELIVVITILAVLATVAFISFQGYTSSSRDSVRLIDLKNISKSFELNKTKLIPFPLPNKKVDISLSGSIFQYQWELSKEILTKDLNIFDGWVDPLTWENYWYAVNAAKNKFQIIAFLENNQNASNIVKNHTFADNNDKFIKTSWDTLGILLDSTSKEIISDENNSQQIDLQNNSQNYSVVIQDGNNQEIDAPKIYSYISSHNDSIIEQNSLQSKDPSLVGFWDMSSLTSDGKMKDFSMYGNDATCSDLDGEIDCSEIIQYGYIQWQEIWAAQMRISNSESLKVPTGEYTIAVKFKLDKNPADFLTQFPILFWNRPYQVGWYMIHLLRWDETVIAQYCYTWTCDGVKATTLQKDIWYEVVWVRRQTTLEIYVNGVLIDSIENPNEMWIAWSGTEISRDVPGVIDFVKIYNKALSQSDIIAKKY